MSELIYTGSKLCGQKIFIESTGDKDIDKAFKTVFHDSYHKTAPLEMRRADIRLCIAFNNRPKKYRQGSR